VVSWSDTSIVVTAPAFDGGTVVQVAVYTNNGISNGVNFTFPSYQFFPPSLSIVVGQVATVTAKDSQKQVVTGLSWSSSDPTIASVSDDGFITGVAPGSTTVYGGNVPLPVTVYAGTSLPPGTVLWSAPLGPGATRVTSLVPAVPSDSGADILTYDDAEFLSAFTSDGELLWRQGVLDVRKVMPDFAGNTLVSRRAVVIAADGTWHEHQVISRVDPNTGNLTDFYGYADKLVGSCTISPATGGSYQSLCYDDHTSFERAIPGVSGVLFVQENAAVTAVDIPTNQSLGSVTLNHGTTNLGGTVESVDPIYGQIIVAGDGNAYVPYSYGSTVVSHPGQQVAVFHKEDHSMVLRMSPDGTSANIELGAWNSDTTVTSSSGLPGIDPATVIDSEHDHWSGSTSFISSSVITNADTSVAVSGPINPGRCTDVYLGTYWTKDANGDTIFHPFYQTSGCPDSNHPHTEISYVSQDAVTSQVDVPLASFVPSLQREDGSYIGADNDRQLDAVALDGTPLWSKAIDHDVYGTAIPVTPQYATPGGGTIATSTTKDQNGVTLYGALYTVDNTGGVTGQSADSGAVRTWIGQSYAVSASSISKVQQAVAVEQASFQAVSGGNPTGNGAAVALCPCLFQTEDDLATAVVASGSDALAVASGTPAQDQLAPQSDANSQSSAALVSSQACPICDLQPPACKTIDGAQSTFVLIIGDPGLDEHNLDNLFNLAAQQKANELQAQGHRVVACRASSIQDFANALLQHGFIDGGVIYFGHSGPFAPRSAPQQAVSILAVGQATGQDTNISFGNVQMLANVRNAYIGADQKPTNIIGPHASIVLNGCNAGLTIYDNLALFDTSIAQQIANKTQRAVYAYQVGMYFSNVDSDHDPFFDGTDPKNPKKSRHVPGRLPMYLIPAGPPHHKPKLDAPFIPEANH